MYRLCGSVLVTVCIDCVGVFQSHKMYRLCDSVSVTQGVYILRESFNLVTWFIDCVGVSILQGVLIVWECFSPTGI